MRRPRFARAEIPPVFCEAPRLAALRPEALRLEEPRLEALRLVARRLLLPALCLALIGREWELPRRALLLPPRLPRVRLAEREPVFD